MQCSAFAQRIVAQTERLATTLSAEVGKPIASRATSSNGLLGRIDFFLEHAEAALRAEQVVHDDGGMRERITHEPLGVVANISAWNYPYFVGCNVFVPALLAGNAVLYKPSEFATLTGLHIARLLHEAGVPRRRVRAADRRRRRRRGAARAAASTACSSPAATPPARASRSASATRW